MHLPVDYRPIYLIFLPIIWIALQRGLMGVSTSILFLNFGVILAMVVFQFDPARLVELELLMIIICIIGLLVGSVVTERKQDTQDIASLAKYPFENPNPVLRLSQDGTVMQANPASAAVLDMWGCSMGGSAPRFWCDLAAQVLASGENKTIDIEIDRKVYSMFVAPVTGSGYVNLYGRDITEGKQAEEALRDSQQMLKTVLNTIPVRVFWKGTDSKYLGGNLPFAQDAGLQLSDELVGKDDFQMTWREQAELYRVDDYSVMEFGQSKLGYEELQTKSDGSQLWLRTSKVPLRNAFGQIIGLLGTYEDITKSKQAEEEIKISNDELSMLFELSHSLAEAGNLEDVLDLVNRHTVESIHTTFARIALLENEKFIMRAAYPIRPLDHNLRIGERYQVTTLPYAQHILEQKEPMIIRASDPGISSEEKKVLLLDFAQSLCLIPLLISDSSSKSENTIGLLMLGEARNEGREPFTPQKMRLAQTIGDSAAIAIRRMLLREQTELHLRQLVALSEIDLAIISSSDIHFSLEVLLSASTGAIKRGRSRCLAVQPDFAGA